MALGGKCQNVSTFIYKVKIHYVLRIDFDTMCAIGSIDLGDFLREVSLHAGIMCEKRWFYTELCFRI